MCFVGAVALCMKKLLSYGWREGKKQSLVERLKGTPIICK